MLTVTVLAFWPNKYNPNADGRFNSGWCDYRYWPLLSVTVRHCPLLSGRYPTGATLIINALVGDLFVIGLLVDGGRPQDLFARCVPAPCFPA